MRRVVIAFSLAACGRVGFDEVRPDAPPGTDIEAEQGTVLPNFRVVSDSTASGGAYVVDDNNDGFTGPGQLTITLTPPTTGTYYLWMRTITANMGNDSFFMSIDGAPDFELDNAACVYTPDWHWASFRSSQECPPALPAPLSLMAGSHTFAFHSREGQSRVDRVRILADQTLVPTD
jgi:hypothetical protein